MKWVAPRRKKSLKAPLSTPKFAPQMKSCASPPPGGLRVPLRRVFIFTEARCPHGHGGPFVGVLFSFVPFALASSPGAGVGCCNFSVYIFTRTSAFFCFYTPSRANYVEGSSVLENFSLNHNNGKILSCRRPCFKLTLSTPPQVLQLGPQAHLKPGVGEASEVRA